MQKAQSGKNRQADAFADKARAIVIAWLDDNRLSSDEGSYGDVDALVTLLD